MLLRLGWLFAAGSLLADPYTLRWSNTDAGGGASNSGNYGLTSTIGQTGTTLMCGGSYRLDGGFLPSLIVSSTTAAPTLVLRLVNDQLWISWSPATPGFRLEQTGDLLSPNWISAPTGNPVTVSLPAKAQFYRLRMP